MMDSTASKIVIAHRGASAYLPEHTLEAYSLAYSMGAHFIEPDIVMTKDGVLICLHDLYLETTTDVAEVFSDRAAEDGHFYAIDFSLGEIKQLRTCGRVPANEREPLPRYEVPTLEEMIQMIQSLNKRTGREVGILSELKDPEFHAQRGKPMEKPLLELLARYDCEKRGSKVIVQCFDSGILKRLRGEHKAELTLVFLTSNLLSATQLDDLSTYVNGIGANRLLIEDEQGQPVNDNALVKACRERGLLIFVWTMKAEQEVMRRFYYLYGVDGIISDYPDLAVRAAVR
jgi:glycerophosphoryl diester phosphodiesterase